ncbi:MAG TPA: aminoglycoside phosphotransferase [Trebonia sp.]
MAFEDALATWLVKQRWFAGKGRELRDLAVVADTQVIDGDPELRHLVVTVSHGTSVDYYQVPVGVRHSLPGRLEHALIGPSGDGRQLYDALHDAELTRPLIEGIANDATIGSLQLRKVDGAAFDTGLDSLVISSEQSNTSLVYGEESILKVFRRVSPGPNPDLEVTTALARLGSDHIAEPLGWIETRLDGAPTSLAILSHYLRLASDGWSLAATSVRDLYAQPGTAAADAGGDFAGEARRLGQATAEVHASIATAFGTDEVGADVVSELTEQMFRKLDLSIAAVPELGKYAEMIGDAYSQLAKLNGPFLVQRVHGDYHLGQVLRTPETGWVVLDFEGEPATPLAQRRARSSPLRDVAGMLRSFDYAARHQLIGRPDADAQETTARDWVHRNCGAFCAGYAEAGGLDPEEEENAVLLRALQLDKAVYEVLYEARHRPSWLPIPLDSLADF